jgi:hypothetical protein
MKLPAMYQYASAAEVRSLVTALFVLQFTYTCRHCDDRIRVLDVFVLLLLPAGLEQ